MSRVIQCFKQKSDERAEVRTILEQHLNVRPEKPQGYSFIANMVAIAVTLALMGFMFLSLRYSRLPSLNPTLQVIVACMILVLSEGALVGFLLLPVERTFSWYRLTLAILYLIGPWASCAALATLFVTASWGQGSMEHFFISLAVGWVPATLQGFIVWQIDQRRWRKISPILARADLLQTYLNLEGLILTSNHLLRRPKKEKEMSDLDWANEADMPRFYLARHPDGKYAVAFEEVLPVSIMKRLATVLPETAWNKQEEIIRILAEDRPCAQIRRGIIYIFQDDITPEAFSGVKALPAIPQSEDKYEVTLADISTGFFAYVVDERIEALCRSRRISDNASEAWLQPGPADTNEIRQAALAWAYTQQYNRKVPFFCHDSGDEDAAALARSLRLRLVAEEVAYY